MSEIIFFSYFDFSTIPIQRADVCHFELCVVVWKGTGMEQCGSACGAQFINCLVNANRRFNSLNPAGFIAVVANLNIDLTANC